MITQDIITSLRAFGLLITLGLLGCGSPSTNTTTSRPPSADTTLTTDRWVYIEIDSTKAMWGDYDDPDWLRYFGLATGDINGDGLADIVSGRNVYLNPGGDMQETWKKLDLGHNVDANLIVSSSSGPFILAESLPDVLRFTPTATGGFTEPEVVAQVPPTGHHNGQGYKTADLLPGNDTEEIIYASQGGLYVIDPSTPAPWDVTLVGKGASDEGVGVADMDGDGDLDLVSGYRIPGEDAEVPKVVVWFENPGQLTADWKRHPVGNTLEATDRVEAADMDGDGLADIIVSEEMYPGLTPNANLWVFLQRPKGFDRRKVITQYSMNNLGVADMDGDGDLDLLTAEHKGPRLSLQLWKNDGAANFERHEIDTGRESHLGTQPFDMDGDGDLDIISIGWDKHNFVHLWRNDAIQ